MGKTIFIIKPCIIFCVLIFISDSALAENISISYPEKAVLGEIFSAELELIDFANDSYDIKIDLLINGERIARIFNNEEWKSTFYYINDAIKLGQTKQAFRINATENGTAEIVVKIKDSNEKTKVYIGYKINILESLGSRKELNMLKNISANNDSYTANNSEISASKKTKSPAVINNNLSIDLPDYAPKNIILNKEFLTPKSIKTEFSSKINAVYGILIFCALLIGAMLIKKLFKKENEFR